MLSNKKVWVLKPTESVLWDAESGKEHEFVERIWLAEWILDKWKRGDVVVVEHIHANDTSKKRRI